MIPAATGATLWLISILTIAACWIAAHEDTDHAKEGEEA